MVVAKCILIVVAIALFWSLAWVGDNLVDQRIPLDEARALRTIRDLVLAQGNYAEQHVETGFACNLSSLREGDLGLGIDDSVDPILASGTKSGYYFALRCSQDSKCKATNYEITAVPMIPGTTGIRAFCSDQSSKIWYSKRGSAEECLARQNQMQPE